MRTYPESVQWDTADEPFERIGTLLGSSLWREAHLPSEGIVHFRLCCRPLRPRDADHRGRHTEEEMMEIGGTCRFLSPLVQADAGCGSDELTGYTPKVGSSVLGGEEV